MKHSHLPPAVGRTLAIRSHMFHGGGRGLFCAAGVCRLLSPFGAQSGSSQPERKTHAKPRGNRRTATRPNNRHL